MTRRRAEEVLPHLTYLRINFSAGEAQRYGQIMGVKEACFDRVCGNIRDIVLRDHCWEDMNHLASPGFNAQAGCPTLCLQHKFNEALDNHVKGRQSIAATKGAEPPMHINFI